MLRNDRRLLTVIRWVILLAIPTVFFLPRDVVRAHPVDMYAQNQAILFTRVGLQVDWKIIPGPLLADAVWGAADQNHDGSINLQEAQAWCAPLLSQWRVDLDNRRMDPGQVQDIHWPATIDAFRTGEDAIWIKLSIPWTAGDGEKHRLEIHNSFQEANSLNWFSLTAKEGLSFDEPAQDNGQLRMDITFPHTSGGSSTETATALTSWDSGKPHLPGFTDAISKLALNLSDSQQQSSGPPSATSALVGLVKAQQFSAWFFVGAFLLSLALGSLHALTPGHGKTLVAAYLVGSQGRARDAIFLGLIVTVTHTGSVLLLGLLTLLASHYILPSLIAPWLEVISGLLVIGFGIHLFLQRKADLYAWLVTRREKKPAKFTYQPGQASTFSLQNAQVSGLYMPGPLLPQPFQEHSHDGIPHQHAGHTHSHSLPPTNQVTLKSLITFGISGGLVPCPDAIAILLVAVALDRIPFGMLLILAFSIGLAFVLIGIGLAMVQGIRFIGRNDLLNRFSLYTPIISAVVVSGLGVGLTLNALNSFSLTSAVLQPAPLFDIKQAKLVYLAPDSQRQNQLSVVSLSTGTPLSYTRETSGVAGYSLSLDRKTILYTLINMDGSSSLWAIGTDGTDRHSVLDCPHAECVGPVWYPDGQKLVYERLNYATGSSVSVFSIWWLDLKTGETRPVFQDQAFPSIAPGFSSDGQWLSYISPLNNTIQFYNLKEDRRSSISLSRGYQPRIAQPWDPLDTSILFWEPGSGDESSALRVKRYDLASGQSIDLGGSNNQVEFETAWSADGQWIAIVRDSSSSGSPGQRQEIWLVRPDGSGGHSIVSEEHVSYSNLGWSPDSRFLVYCRYSTDHIGKPEIWLADLMTGNQARLVTGGILPLLLP